MQTGHFRFCALPLFPLVSMMAAVKTKGNTNIGFVYFCFCRRSGYKSIIYTNQSVENQKGHYRNRYCTAIVPFWFIQRNII